MSDETDIPDDGWDAKFDVEPITYYEEPVPLTTNTGEDDA